MKLICLIPIPHGLHHLTVGDEFDEPDAVHAQMLVYLGRAKPAETKAATYQTRQMVAAPAPVAPLPITAPAVPEGQDQSGAAHDDGDDKTSSTETEPIGTSDAPTTRVKRQYIRKTAA